jgi:hypothetical protein
VSECSDNILVQTGARGEWPFPKGDSFIGEEIRETFQQIEVFGPAREDEERLSEEITAA